MVEIKLHRGFAKEVLKSEGVRKVLEQDARRMAGKAPIDGYHPSAIIGKNRARASVITTSSKAVRDNAKNQTLLRILHG